MNLPVAIIVIRLFIRFFLGALLISTGVSKLTHPGQFWRGLQDYQLLPTPLAKKRVISMLLTFGIPWLECVAGLSLICGIALLPALLLVCGLLLVFSLALGFNLARGRTDLSCHCGGVIGDHRISWWLVGRNAALIVLDCLLLFTPPDRLTIDNFLREPTLLHDTFFTTLVPVVLLVGVTLVILVLLNSLKSLLTPDQ